MASTGENVIFNDVKSSIDVILNIVKTQAKKQDERELLLQSLSVKVDIQGQRVCHAMEKLDTFETDLKEIKGWLTSSNIGANQAIPNKATLNQATVNQATLNQATLNQATLHLATPNQEIPNTQLSYPMNKGNIEELKCLIRDEIGHIGKISHIMEKLNQAESKTVPILQEATKDLKRVISAVKELDRGVRFVEKAMDDTSGALTILTANTIATHEELSSKLDNIETFSDEQMHHMSKQIKYNSNAIRDTKTKCKNSEEQMLSVSKQVKSNLNAICESGDKFKNNEEKIHDLVYHVKANGKAISETERKLNKSSRTMTAMAMLANITQKVVWVEEQEKVSFLFDLIESMSSSLPIRGCASYPEYPATAIFVETDFQVQELDLKFYRYFKMGLKVTTLLEHVSRKERESTLQNFYKESFPTEGTSCYCPKPLPILVTSISPTEYLDMPTVRHVINFELPRDIETYVNRIGRTGRNGKLLVTSFFNNNDKNLVYDMIDLLRMTKQEVPAWLEAMRYYGNSESNALTYY